LTESQSNPTPLAQPKGRAFVGRSRGMKSLLAAARSCYWPVKPGIGKTRIAQELAHYAEAQGEAALGMVLRKRGSAAVGGTVDLSEAGAQVHDARVSGPEHEGPWRSASLRVVQPFPTVARVGAAVGTFMFRCKSLQGRSGESPCRPQKGLPAARWSIPPLVGARRQGVDAAFLAPE